MISFTPQLNQLFKKVKRNFWNNSFYLGHYALNIIVE